MEPTEQVLKTDVTGRVWTPKAQRDAILDQFESSGVSAAQFAAMVGVKYPTLANWIQRRRNARREGASGTRGLKWVEAAVDCAPPSSALVVQLPGGASLAVSDAKQATLAGELLRSFIGGSSAC